jgi:hypothetical protein
MSALAPRLLALAGLALIMGAARRHRKASHGVGGTTKAARVAEVCVYGCGDVGVCVCICMCVVVDVCVHL